MNISEVTLLSKEEYEQYIDNISIIDEWWWLRSPGRLRKSAVFVYDDGSLGFSSVSNDSLRVRPALRILNLNSSNLAIKDHFELAGYTWTVISDEIVLCDDTIGKCPFRNDWNSPDANDYETSDVKRFLEMWVKDVGLDIECEQKLPDVNVERDVVSLLTDKEEDIITIETDFLPF